MTTTLRSKPPRSKDTDLGKPAVELAEQLLLESMKLEQPSERRSMHKLSRLMDDQEGKELTFHLTDQVFRPPLARRSAGLFRSLIRRHGIPRYLGTLDQLMMGLGALVSRMVPGLVMPAITRRLIEESREVILPAEQLSLDKHVTRRRSEGAAINLNLLGEAVLGEQEATQRLERNLEAIRSGTADYISIKLSSIFSQITLTAPEFSKQQLSDRLRLLYRAALKRSPHPFINLDMEEYRDLQLTLDVFRSVLSEPEFLGLRAGIVLQAYLPDTHPLQIELTRWARERVDRGGAPIKVRLVKGANLAMEKADAELHDWPQAPYPTKAEVDANYLRMLDFACRPENAKVVHVGVASHNLFNLAHAILLREQRGVGDLVEIEMLEGMAAPQARAVLPRAKSVLFYAPVVEKEDFNAAIAYLIRRLDENTTPGNFLHDLFDIQPGNEAWKRQRDAFLKALADSAQVDSSPRRCQNRQTQRNSLASGTFRNTPDTDFSLPANQKWLDQALKHPPRDLDSGPAPTIEDIKRVIATAATSSWPDTKLDERASLIKRAALGLEHSRADLIAEMNREGNKAPAEADVEVSEAVDFANYYSHSFRGNAWDDGLDHEPIGPVVITPPWNFPCAIPCGGILAALMAGNPVIIKPAPETVRIARLMTECLWRAGIPRDALQFTTAPDNEVGQRLVADPRIAAVILTGSSRTADLFLSWRPELPLFAETSGKNALIVTAAADPDLAIKDLVRSAFHHSGQKCSAASIALVEASLLEDGHFLDRLRDAAASLKVGPSTDPSSIVTPLIQAPSDDLLRGLTKLEPGESWLLEPSQPDPDDPRLWTPGIRIGVEAGAWIQGHELFGPVLAIIPFDTLEQAIAIQNDSAFALTGGIHSLDPDEIALWKSKVEVGNAYINRPITGAIVRRQPFGGWKNSSIGPGAKAGGPNYVAQFINPVAQSLPQLSAPIALEIRKLLDACRDEVSNDDFATLEAAVGNASYWWQREFSKEHDPSRLAPESNDFRYRPVPRAILRIHPSLKLVDAILTTLMAKVAGVSMNWSTEAALDSEWNRSAIALDLELVTENEPQLRERLERIPLASVRSPGQPLLRVHNRCHHAPVTPHARLEMLPYLLEQAVTETRHRHGRLPN